MLKQVRENPAFLARYGAANTGMQDNGAHNDLIYFNESDEDGNQIVLGPHEAWAHIANKYSEYAELFHKAGYAKQVCNRLIEPFQMMKVVMTATELNNFKWLRRHDAADPTIDSLTQKVITAQEASTPVILQSGEWHVPYYMDGYWKPKHERVTSIDDFTPSGEFVDVYGNTLEHALVISASCCAQVSYRKLDDTTLKAHAVVARLNLHGEEPDQPVHASPLEHQATPIAEYVYQHGFAYDFEVNAPGFPHTWEDGITHMDRDGTLCSGNLKSWIQHRQLVPNHVKRG
jgi:hypothetical protein